MNWRPGTCRQVLVFMALALGVRLGSGSLHAMDIFLPVKVPMFIPPIPAVPLNARVIHIPMQVSRPPGFQRVTLEATLYQPDGPGPFPLLVLSHGTPRNPRQRVAQGRLTYNAQSWEFVSLGFAVVIPMRRGYGRSGGDYAEAEGSCDRARFYPAGVASARDLRTAVNYVSALPGIDPHRLILAGYSSGGFASLILASQGLPGLRGVINFNGGRGSTRRRNCSPEGLIAACALAGRTLRVPTLWVYAKNDSFFPPPLARKMCAAFRRAGGWAEFVMLPPFYEEGHFLFPDVRGLAWWTPVVNRFLNDLGFPGKMPRP